MARKMHSGGKRTAVKLVKQILLSSPQFVSVGALNVHEVPQKTQKNYCISYPKMPTKNTFYVSN
jgi:hypothetical protein